METRTIKELLQLTLDNIDHLSTGLCSLIAYHLCENNRIITVDEWMILDDYIESNRPHNKHYYTGDNYYWKIGNKTPRINWLKKQIKSL